MDILFQTWPWYVSGFLIAIIMLTLNYFGKIFGMSSNLQTLCTMAGADRFADYFKFNWKSNRWNLAVVLGAMLGGFVAVHFLSHSSNVSINPKTIEQLAKMGIEAPNGKLLPKTLFGNEVFQSPKMIFILIIG